MNPFQKVAKNWIVLISKSIFMGIWSLFITAYIARGLGVDNYGTLTFALTFVSLFGLIGNLGLYSLVVREIARNTDTRNIIFGDAIILKIILGIFMLSIIITIIYFSRYPLEKTIVLYIASLSLLFEILTKTFTSIFEGFQKMEFDAIASFITAIVHGLLAIGALWLGYRIIGIAFVYLITALFAFLFNLCLILKFFTYPSFGLTYNGFLRMKNMLKEALPFAFTGLFVMLQFKIDIIMLSAMKGDTDVGLYNAAAKLTYSLLIIAAALSTSLYPALSELFYKDRKKANELFQLSLYFLIIIGLPIAIGGMLTSNKIILLVFGKEYIYSAKILQIIVWYVPLCFLGCILSNSLNAIDKQIIVAKIAFIQTLFNFCFNLLLIPRYGGLGAACTTVCTEIIGVVCYIFFLKPVFGFNFVRLPSIFYCNTLLTLVIIALSKMNLAIIIIVSSIIYSISMFLFRVTTFKDIAIVKGLLFERYK